MKLLITICARGGSKGIPGKNIKPLNGKPLIYYTIRVAKQFQEIFDGTDIVISTDSKEIKAVAETFGLFCEYLRPESLAGDAIGKVDVIADVLKWQESRNDCDYEYVLDLDVTSPLRNLDDLVQSFKIIQADEQALNLFSVSPAKRNPYFNMVEQKDTGYFAQVVNPRDVFMTRQSTPKVYDMNASFYFYKREFFNCDYKGVVTDRSLIYEIPHICFDLDHPYDYEIISFLMSNDKLDFAF